MPQRIAIRQGVVGQGRDSVYYLHADHLGSVSEVTSATGGRIAQERYYPYGRVRWGSAPTSYNFTGRRLDPSTGLLFFQARYYDPALMRFAQADTMVPNPGDPQQLNRYSYTLNNPLKYTDPTGHWFESVIDIVSIGYDLYDISQNGLNWENGLSLVADVGSLALPVVTGGGALVRAVAHADDAIDATRGAINVVQAANQADNALDAINAARRLAEVGLDSSEAAGLVKDIARASTKPGTWQAGTVVLGHFPEYRNLAESLGATYLDIDPAVWDELGKAGGKAADELRWAVNKQFLDDAVARGDTFRLAGPRDPTRGGFFLQRELDYLTSLGYSIQEYVDGFWVLVK